MNLEKEEPEYIPDPPKILHQNTQCTTRCLATPLSPFFPSYDIESGLLSSTDTSFEIALDKQNMNSIKIASNQLLEDSLIHPQTLKDGFKDPNLINSRTLQIPEENDLDSILFQNQLLTKSMTNEIRVILEKEDGLLGLLRQAVNSFGLTVAKELVYVIYYILHLKIDKFYLFLKFKEPLIPKIPCFQDCSEDTISLLTTSCPIYEEISIEEIIQFAQKDIESIANSIYFSNIRILNLKDITLECKKEVNVIQKFAKFIKQVSRSVFLAIIGATEPPQGGVGFELSRQISLAEISQFGLTQQKSLSRPFLSCNQQQEDSYDFVSKKIKRQ